MQIYFYQRKSHLNMFSLQKITKLTLFNVTLRAKMLSKLILTGGKNDKILTTVVVWAYYAWILTKSQYHTLSMISESKLFENFCKLQQKHAIMNELWVKL